MNISLLGSALRFSLALMLLAGSFISNGQSHTPRYQSIISNSNGFYEYLPQGYNNNESYPLIVFIHGVGELGNGNPGQLKTVLKNGLPRVIDQGNFPTSFTTSRGTFKFIVISPEFINWPNANDVQGVIDYAVKTYRVDQSRIYLTGLSMGGGVCWDYPGASIQNASRLAALVPVCGSSDPDPIKSLVMATSNLPIWALHNDGDPQVPVWNTNRFVDLINALFPTPLARKTIFRSTDHDAWTTSFDPNFRENGMNIYEWMLQYSRGNSNPSTPSNQAPSANAGSDISISLPTSTVTISGSGSDPDGKISSYSWVLLKGPNQPAIANSVTERPTISNLVAGEYIFRLTVSDNAGATAYDDVLVTVNGSIAAPPADNLQQDGGANDGKIFTLPTRIESENYNAMSGIMNESTSDDGGGLNVGYINANDWIDYRVRVQTAGTYTVSFRTATASNNQRFQVKNSIGNVLATVEVPNTGSFQKWTTTTSSINLNAGDQTLRIYSLTEFWNINWMSFDMQNAGRPAQSSQHIEAEEYSAMSGIDVEACFDNNGGLNVDWINGGDWMDYTINAPSSGNYTFNFRLATSKKDQQFQLKNANGDVLNTINVPNTGNFQSWTTVSANAYLSAGKQTIRIYSLSQFWNINWFEFSNTGADASNAARIDNQSLNVLGEKTAGAADQIDVSIYPNPAREKFVLTVSNPLRGTMQVQVLDQSGAVRKTYSYTKNQNTMQLSLPASDLPTGTYYIRTVVGKWRGTSKLVKF